MSSPLKWYIPAAVTIDIAGGYPGRLGFGFGAGAVVTAAGLLPKDPVAAAGATGKRGVVEPAILAQFVAKFDLHDLEIETAQAIVANRGPTVGEEGDQVDRRLVAFAADATTRPDPGIIETQIDLDDPFGVAVEAQPVTVEGLVLEAPVTNPGGGILDHDAAL
jgi:hypothetical protein